MATFDDDDDDGVCACVREQNVTGPEEDAEAVVLWLHRHPVRTQSGAAAGVSIFPGKCVGLDLAHNFR